MTSEQLKDLALTAIEDLKGQDVVVLDVKKQADFTDYMIVVSGTSDRHLKAMSNEVFIQTKRAGFPALNVSGEDSRDWILVDLGDVVVHLMKPETRQLYEIEKLWSLTPSNRDNAE